MRINEYNNLQDFINEYDGKFEIGDEFSMGIEFYYRNKKYRMCREPNANQKFYVYRVINPDCSFINGLRFDVIGIYDTMDDLLKAKPIGHRPFSEVIMDDNTRIDSKD